MHGIALNNFDVDSCPMQLFASGGSEHNILLWSPYQEEVCGRLIGHETSVRKIEATCDPYRVVSVSCDNVGARAR